MSPTKYAQVGVGSRASFFYTAVARDFRDTAELVAFCDTNQTRLNVANANLEKLSRSKVPTYKAADFDRMIKETKPDQVIVTTIDRTHHGYIIRAMELGCDVISEKPMTTDEIHCQEILDAVKRTGRKVRVAFNYRCKIRQIPFMFLFFLRTIVHGLAPNKHLFSPETFSDRNMLTPRSCRRTTQHQDPRASR